MLSNYSNLALSGGAFKSIGLLGAVKYLEEIDILKDFKNYIGTSGGGLILFFLLIGYTSNEITNILKDEITYLSNFNYENITDLYTEMGIDNGDKNENILRKYLYSKTQMNSITFIEFAKKFGYNLIITGANITKEKIDYFSVDTFPEMDIIQALLITSRIPIIYKPIKFNDDLYLDGGIYSNFPIEYFENHHNDTLGICVNQNYLKEYSNIMNLFNNLIFSLMNKLSYDNIRKNKDKYNICEIKFTTNSSNDISFSFDNMTLDVNPNIFEEYTDFGYDKFKIFYNTNKNNIEI
tara:strand:- start:445 stop:1326 length:882 start_codon:yes stop_codon:yes gene_type:complete